MLGLGHTVCFLSAENSVQPRAEELDSLDRYSVLHFRTFAELASALKKALNDQFFDVAIHLAAVSDYSLADGAAATKNDSSEEMVLKLRKNPKLVESIRPWSKNRALKLVAFKLTATADLSDRKTRLEKLILNSKPDFVVTNDLAELPKWKLIDANHVSKERLVIAEGSTREELGFSLEGVL